MLVIYLDVDISGIALLDALLGRPAVAFNGSKVLAVHHHVGFALEKKHLGVLIELSKSCCHSVGRRKMEREVFFRVLL